jgi:hypothetical protein
MQNGRNVPLVRWDANACVSRRSFLILVGSTAITLTGCREDKDTEKLAGGLQTGGSLVSTAGALIPLIPHVAATQVGQIVSAVGGLMSTIGSGIQTTRSFQAGDTLNVGKKMVIGQLPDKLELVQPSEDELRQISSRFKAADNGGKHFDTPIVTAVRYSKSGNQIQRKLDVQCRDNAQNHSLVSGYNNSAYRVHNWWVDWLLQEDNCDLIVAGHTQREVFCHHSGCRIRMMTQHFVGQDDKPITLARPYDDEDISRDELARHYAHSPEYKGCPIVEDRCPDIEVRRLPD